MLGEGASLLGGSSESLEGLAGVAGSFSQLGLDPAMVNQFIPPILSFVESQGGETVRNLLAAVLQ
jgi:hypothetical protein